MAWDGEVAIGVVATGRGIRVFGAGKMVSEVSESREEIRYHGWLNDLGRMRVIC